MHMSKAPSAVLAAYRFARAFYRRLRRRSVFEEIYDANLWGDRESRSGSGSGLAATEKIRAGLIDILARLNIRSMIDAPCGDYYWLSSLDLAHRLDWYAGYDIVATAIEHNRQSWGSDKISFEVRDLVKHAPPAADLILCRHLLIHLPLADCLKVLRNFKSSGSRYLMITNQPHIEKNDEILFTGSFRPLNLHLPPFGFPKPLLSVDDAQAPGDRSEASLFPLADLPL